MIVHPFWLETITAGVRRVHAHSGELLGEVWRRTEGDFLPMKPYGAAMTPTGRDDALHPIGIYATETEAIAAVIRWCLDHLGNER